MKATQEHKYDTEIIQTHVNEALNKQNKNINYNDIKKTPI